MASMIEVAIIGAGPAGIAAAIYLKRAGLEPVVFEPGKPGGLLRNANLVENYPGFSGGISGDELSARFAEHLARLGVKTRKERVESLALTRGAFRIGTDAGIVTAKAVIVAAGTVPSEPDINGSSAMIGKSVFFDVVSMPIIGAGSKKVIVVGGGDAAFDYALNLDGRGHRVTIVSRSSPRCLGLLLERVRNKGIELNSGVTVKSVAQREDGISVRCVRGGKTLSLSADWLLVACGRTPNLKFVEPKLRELIDVRARPPETGVHGLYFAGDVIRGPNRQVGIAVGDGILAAMLAHRYLAGGGP